MRTIESPLSKDDAAVFRLLRRGAWIQACVFAVLAFGCTLLGREAEMLVLQIRQTASSDAVTLPLMSKSFFAMMPNTFAAMTVLAAVFGMVFFILHRLVVKHFRPRMAGLVGTHLLAVLFGGLIGLWLIMVCLCTLVPLIAWPA